jgi:hypothetical protein
MIYSRMSSPVDHSRAARLRAGCEEYCEREVDEADWQGGQVYLHLGARRDEPPRR